MFGKKFPSENFTQSPEIMAFYHNFEDENFFYSDICKGCGACCKRSGCTYGIEDFEIINKNSILNHLKEGNTSIVSTMYTDYVQGKLCTTPILYLQARGKGKGIVDLFSFRTECSMLTESGCRHEKKERPLGSKLLIPIEVNGQKDCKMLEDVQGVLLREWMDYQKLLEKMVKYFTGNTVKQELAKEIEKVVLIVGRKLLQEQKISEEEIDFIQSLRYLDEDYFASCRNCPKEFVACMILARKV